MSDSPDRSPDPDELRDVLDDLRRTLDELETAVDVEDREHGRVSRRDDREPPRGSDVVRFTETYTIPTVISVLETTIQSLELLRGVLRLADPDRRGEREASPTRGASVDRRVVEGTERALDDLRRALTGNEIPPDAVGGDVLGDARALTREIESLLQGARQEDGRRGAGSRSERSGVVIPVDDGEVADTDERLEGSDDREMTDSDDDPVTIDIDAELESIKDEVRGVDEPQVTDESGTEGDGDEAEDDGREER